MRNKCVVCGEDHVGSKYHEYYGSDNRVFICDVCVEWVARGQNKLGSYLRQAGLPLHPNFPNYYRMVS